MVVVLGALVRHLSEHLCYVTTVLICITVFTRSYDVLASGRFVISRLLISPFKFKLGQSECCNLNNNQSYFLCGVCPIITTNDSEFSKF